MALDLFIEFLFTPFQLQGKSNCGCGRSNFELACAKSITFQKGINEPAQNALKLIFSNFNQSKFRQSKEMQQIGKQVFVAWYEVAKANSAFWADLRAKGKKLQQIHVCLLFCYQFCDLLSRIFFFFSFLFSHSCPSPSCLATSP